MSQITLTIPRACDRWGTSRSYLYRLAGDGKIIFRKVGRRTLVDVASGDKYFTLLPVAKIKPVVTQTSPKAAR
jgi:excisionase family DNA binding protein